MNIPMDAPASKIRILALHGRGSNGDITRMQLRNLGLSESEYDVFYANGPVPAERPGPGIEGLEDLVPGPWYSWLPENNGGSENGDALTNAI